MLLLPLRRQTEANLSPDPCLLLRLRTNADLSKRLRDAQNELMASKAEVVQLCVENAQLQVTIAALKDQLGRVKYENIGSNTERVSGPGLHEEALEVSKDPRIVVPASDLVYGTAGLSPHIGDCDLPASRRAYDVCTCGKSYGPA